MEKEYGKALLKNEDTSVLISKTPTDPDDGEETNRKLMAIFDTGKKFDCYFDFERKDSNSKSSVPKPELEEVNPSSEDPVLQLNAGKNDVASAAVASAPKSEGENDLSENLTPPVQNAEGNVGPSESPVRVPEFENEVDILKNTDSDSPVPGADVNIGPSEAGSPPPRLAEGNDISDNTAPPLQDTPEKNIDPLEIPGFALDSRPMMEEKNIYIQENGRPSLPKVEGKNMDREPEFHPSESGVSSHSNPFYEDCELKSRNSQSGLEGPGKVDEDGDSVASFSDCASSWDDNSTSEHQSPKPVEPEPSVEEVRIEEEAEASPVETVEAQVQIIEEDSSTELQKVEKQKYEEIPAQDRRSPVYPAAQSAFPRHDQNEVAEVMLSCRLALNREKIRATISSSDDNESFADEDDLPPPAPSVSAQDTPVQEFWRSLLAAPSQSKSTTPLNDEMDEEKKIALKSCGTELDLIRSSEVFGPLEAEPRPASASAETEVTTLFLGQAPETSSSPSNESVVPKACSSAPCLPDSENLHLHVTTPNQSRSGSPGPESEGMSFVPSAQPPLSISSLLLQKEEQPPSTPSPKVKPRSRMQSFLKTLRRFSLPGPLSQKGKNKHRSPSVPDVRQTQSTPITLEHESQESNPSPNTLNLNEENLDRILEKTEKMLKQKVPSYADFSSTSSEQGSGAAKEDVELEVSRTVTVVLIQEIPRVENNSASSCDPESTDTEAHVGEGTAKPKR
jgi:hypothetical protein